MPKSNQEQLIKDHQSQVSSQVSDYMHNVPLVSENPLEDYRAHAIAGLQAIANQQPIPTEIPSAVSEQLESIVEYSDPSMGYVQATDFENLIKPIILHRIGFLLGLSSEELAHEEHDRQQRRSQGKQYQATIDHNPTNTNPADRRRRAPNPEDSAHVETLEQSLARLNRWLDGHVDDDTAHDAPEYTASQLLRAAFDNNNVYVIETFFNNLAHEELRLFIHGISTGWHSRVLEYQRDLLSVILNEYPAIKSNIFHKELKKRTFDYITYDLENNKKVYIPDLSSQFFYKKDTTRDYPFIHISPVYNLEKDTGTDRLVQGILTEIAKLPLQEQHLLRACFAGHADQSQIEQGSPTLKALYQMVSILKSKDYLTPKHLKDLTMDKESNEVSQENSSLSFS